MNKKSVAFSTLVFFIIMIVVVIVVLMVFYNTVNHVNQTKINQCEKCVDDKTFCSDDEVAIKGFGGCNESQYCCVKKSI